MRKRWQPQGYDGLTDEFTRIVVSLVSLPERNVVGIIRREAICDCKRLELVILDTKFVTFEQVARRGEASPVWMFGSVECSTPLDATWSVEAMSAS